MTVFMVERYARDLTVEGLRLIAEHACAAGAGVYLGSALVPADEGSLCFFDAASADAVARANRSTGAPFERVVEVAPVHPDGMLTLDRRGRS